jgi:hypothetical protein
MAKVDSNPGYAAYCMTHAVTIPSKSMVFRIQRILNPILRPIRDNEFLRVH